MRGIDKTGDAHGLVGPRQRVQHVVDGNMFDDIPERNVRGHSRIPDITQNIKFRTRPGVAEYMCGEMNSWRIRIAGQTRKHFLFIERREEDHVSKTVSTNWRPVRKLAITLAPPACDARPSGTLFGSLLCRS